MTRRNASWFKNWPNVGKIEGLLTKYDRLNIYSKSLKANSLAEGEGFEPPVPFRVQWFSRPPPSTTRPPLRAPQSLGVKNLRRWSILRQVRPNATAAGRSPATQRGRDSDWLRDEMVPRDRWDRPIAGLGNLGNYARRLRYRCAPAKPAAINASVVGSGTSRGSL